VEGNDSFGEELGVFETAVEGRWWMVMDDER
jgi:hypothetical protein